MCEWYSAVLVVVGIGCLLTIVLVPVAFEDLEYDEMGFVRNKASGTVDTSKVYMGGRHFIGVMGEFKKFKHTQYHYRYNNYDVFTTEKILLTISCSVQFVLRPEDLHLLHNVYDLRFIPVITATVVQSLKEASNQYSLDQFRLNRTFVAFGLKKAVAISLDGNCCRKDCKKNYCRPGCKPYTQCKDNEKGTFAALTGFQLKEVDINDAQTKRYLRQVLEQELEDTERFKQDEKVTRMKTVEEKAKIENMASEIAQNANTNSTLIASEASVTSKAIVAGAQNSGLSIIFKNLNMTNEEHKKTLDYVRTLRDHGQTNMYIGFQYMVAQP